MSAQLAEVASLLPELRRLVDQVLDRADALVEEDDEGRERADHNWHGARDERARRSADGVERREDACDRERKGGKVKIASP